MENVWIFNGSNSRFGSAVFTDLNVAKQWIKRYRLSGVLTLYPVNISIFDWAIENNFFTQKNSNHHSPDFIGSFSSASQEHYHFEDGEMGIAFYLFVGFVDILFSNYQNTSIL